VEEGHLMRDHVHMMLRILYVIHRDVIDRVLPDETCFVHRCDSGLRADQ